MFLQKLPSTKRYTFYACASIFVWISMIQTYKVYRSFRTSQLQSEIIQNKHQRRKLKKKNEGFSATNYINEAFFKFRYSVLYAKGKEQYYYLTCTHQHLVPFITELNGLIPSMREHPPILDSDSADSLYIFKGPASNIAESYCTRLCQNFGIELVLSQYNLFMMIAASNNDPKKIEWTQKTIKALNKDEKLLLQIQSILEELADIDQPLIDFYLRDSYLSRECQMVKDIIRAERAIPKLFLDISDYLQFDLRKIIEETNLGAWYIKIALLHQTDLEYLIRLDRMQESLEMWWNTIVYLFSGGENIKGNIHRAPKFSTGTAYSIINFVFRAIMYIPYYILGEGGFKAMFNAQDVEEPSDLDLLKDILSFDDFNTKDIIDFLYLCVTGFIYYTKVIIREPMDLIQSCIINPYKEIPQRYGFYEEATKAGLNFLNKFKKLSRLLRQLEKAIEKDEELAELLQPHLKAIKNLLHNRDLEDFRYVLRQTKKIPEKPITWWELFNPFNLKSTNILRLVKILDDLPEVQEDAWMSGLASACSIDTLVKIATFYHENQKKNSRLNFCMVNMIKDQDSKQPSTPKMGITGMYSIFADPKKVVKNDFSNTFNPKTKEETTMVLQGCNGSGKSFFMRTAAESIVLFQALGCTFADKADMTPLDYLRFLANISDDQREGLSLMMAEAKKLNEDVLQLADGMSNNQKAAFFFDEPGRGTPQDESTKWVLSILAHLRNTNNNITVFSTHLTDLFETAERHNYYKLTPFVTGFDPKKGFTYRVQPGKGEDPISIYVLKNTHFHPAVLKNTIALLAEDKSYRFRDKVIEKKSSSIIATLFDSSRIEGILLLIFFLLLGMLLGLFFPIITDRTRKFLEALKSTLRK